MSSKSNLPDQSSPTFKNEYLLGGYLDNQGIEPTFWGTIANCWTWEIMLSAFYVVRSKHNFLESVYKFAVH